jgi:hypothetical protein
MDEIAAECPDEEWLQPAEGESLDDFENQPWHALYYRAFDALQYDRFYGSHGGQSAIFYTALSQYARDHEISGDDFRRFLTFMNAIDGEHLAIVGEEIKAMAQSDKGKSDG